MNYKGLTQTVEFSGIGIHTGEFSKVMLKPTNNNNVNFITEGKFISPNISNVVSTNRSTTIGIGDAKIFTVEHLMSALYCLYITGIDIIVEGKEIPAADGSARVFVEKIVMSKIIDIPNEIKVVKINDLIKYQINDACYEVLPADSFIISCELITDKSNFVNNQKLKIKITPETYTSQIAYAKTFCYLEEVEHLLSSGFGRGGNFENVILIDRNKVINPEVLTYNDDECVRHKILDFLGDLSLTNLYYLAEFRIVNPSHYANIEFCKQLLQILHSN
ncbi:MAG: UDP-3-O-acyl-N-acetylglucosamine deacetylase [Endomicrobia bacterium]|nr:UDP-3-O-acyl-N-acetylglucosamine deacetylase [Endomicrobiia bacterium]MDW8056252.1 UDP-3-O-acyl-N-acetylglucosamine deacetylase [Elusimicrobiota bacterium]